VRSVAVSTPGKLILMGEHAVVYGRPALIAAIDLRLTARFTPISGGDVHLDLPGLDHSETLSWDALRAYAAAVRGRWEGYALQPGAAGFRALRGEDPAHVVKVALGETGQGTEGLHLRVDSAIPIGQAAEPAVIEALALEVERRQHGQPSGVDGATVLHGGVLWAQRLPAEGGKSGLEREKIATRSPLLDRLRVYDTGTPAEPTGAVVAAVRELRDRDPAGVDALLDRMGEATLGFRAELERTRAGEREDPDRTLHLIREHEACLEGLGVVPAEARAIVRRVEGEGGAAKISGAGSLRGPGAGSLLVYHPDPERISGWAFLRPFPFYPVHLGAPGFREEDPG